MYILSISLDFDKYQTNLIKLKIQRSIGSSSSEKIWEG